MKTKNVVHVMIQGPTQTGKSYAAHALAEWLKCLGAQVVIDESVDITDTDPKEVWQKKLVRGSVWIIQEGAE